ncbi:MAG TPA: invasion associated locus B family protein [Bauldia sp.]|nr:invasion associated locus B family protein [Bauldia sp.]
MITKTMTHVARALPLAFFLSVTLAGAAMAQQAAGGATKLDTFKDWTAFTSDTADGKMCFIATQPTGSKYSQSTSGRDPAFLQITRIPSKNVVNEVSSIAGYTFLASADVTSDVDGTKFKMFLDASHPDTTWADASQEQALVEAMKKGHVFTLTGTSKRKTVVTDTYSLSGITAALDAIAKACP